MRDLGAFGRGRRGARDDRVFQITAARRSISEDIDARTRRYLVSMSIRTACFLLAIVTTGWMRWAFLAGALLLPYISVVIANGGREPTRDMPAAYLGPPRPALEPPREAGPAGPPEDGEQPAGPDRRGAAGETPGRSRPAGPAPHPRGTGADAA